jgi:hypothetical protein
MVTAVDMSGDGCGLVAFVTGGPERSPGTWGAIRLAVMKGVPVVVFACDWSARRLPSLGDGHWASAGPGVWRRGWRWVPDEAEPVGAIEGVVSSVMGWEKMPPQQRDAQPRRSGTWSIRRWLTRGQGV